MRSRPARGQSNFNIVGSARFSINTAFKNPTYLCVLLNRRTFWISALGAFAAPFGLFAYMRREARAYQVTRTEIEIPRLNRPVRLLHLSDFHFSEEVAPTQIQKAINIAKSQESPDLICLTGDYMTSAFPDASVFCETLSPLSNLAPTFAIMGNHDFSRTDHGSVTFKPMIELIKSCGIKVLFNEMSRLELEGQTIEVAGLGDIWSGTCRPQEVFPKNAQERPPRIALSHNPESRVNLRDYSWDLMLSGHTHGGQLRIPFTDIRPFLPMRNKALTSGLYDWENRKIFITRGIGNLHGLRFNCPPEISVLHLIPAKS